MGISPSGRVSKACTPRPPIGGFERAHWPSRPCGSRVAVRSSHVTPSIRRPRDGLGLHARVSSHDQRAISIVKSLGSGPGRQRLVPALRQPDDLLEPCRGVAGAPLPKGLEHLANQPGGRYRLSCPVIFAHRGEEVAAQAISGAVRYDISFDAETVAPASTRRGRSATTKSSRVSTSCASTGCSLSI